MITKNAHICEYPTFRMIQNKIWATSWENLSYAFAKTQISLRICAVRSSLLFSPRKVYFISIDIIHKISRLQEASEAEQAFLSLTWWENTEDRFSHDVASSGLTINTGLQQSDQNSLDFASNTNKSNALVNVKQCLTGKCHKFTTVYRSSISQQYILRYTVRILMSLRNVACHSFTSMTVLTFGPKIIQFERKKMWKSALEWR